MAQRADDVINGAIGHFIHDPVSVEIIGALVYVRLQNEGYLPKKQAENPCPGYYHPHEGQNCRCLKLCKNCGKTKGEHQL